MRVTVQLGAPLRPHAGGAGELEFELTEPSTVAGLLDALGSLHPAVERRIRDETGLLRPHVNVFVDREPVARRIGVDAALHDGAQVLVLPAVSGGG